eukprot:601838-Rhodomonas_salina.1
MVAGELRVAGEQASQVQVPHQAPPRYLASPPTPNTSSVNFHCFNTKTLSFSCCELRRQAVSGADLACCGFRPVVGGQDC